MAASRRIDNRQKKVVTPKRQYGKDRHRFLRDKDKITQHKRRPSHEEQE